VVLAHRQILDRSDQIHLRLRYVAEIRADSLPHPGLGLIPPRRRQGILALVSAKGVAVVCEQALYGIAYLALMRRLLGIDWGWRYGI